MKEEPSTMTPTPSKTDRFDELEELREALWTAAYNEQVEEFDKLFDALLAERKRLRAALGKLLAEVEWREGEDTPYMVYAEMNVEAWRDARSILKEGSAGSATTEEEQER